jgi:hypothetical protein
MRSLFTLDLVSANFVASAAAALKRLHKLAHAQAKNKICVTLLIHRVEALP